MGVPALFRWLEAKYPKIIHPLQRDADGNIINDEGERMFKTNDPANNNINPAPGQLPYLDNLYLDMNGIIHPCTHPEYGPPPKNLEEMLRAIYAYTDNLIQMIRPRKLLYLAIDGVAPRAKMNQQRARRFRAALDLAEKKEKFLDVARDEEAKQAEDFDSNCITPGTPFMAAVAAGLRSYIQAKLSCTREQCPKTYDLWHHLKVILSDSNVPGEGEHKIVDFIRRQRVAGIEALKSKDSLIKLPLSKKPKTNDELGSGERKLVFKTASFKAQTPQEEAGQGSKKDDSPPPASFQPYDPNQTHVIYGLDADLIMLSMATHEPRFYILREDVFAQEAAERNACKRCRRPGHYASECREDGDAEPVPLCQKPFVILRIDVLREYLAVELGTDRPTERAIDDWIFMCFFVGNDFLPHLPSMDIREGAIDVLIGLYKRAVPPGAFICDGGMVDFERARAVMALLPTVEPTIFRNRHAKELKRLQRQQRSSEVDDEDESAASLAGAAAEKKAQSAALQEAHDSIRFHEEGARERYYAVKFGVDTAPPGEAFCEGVVRAYLEGLAWVLAYYYRGCPSWSWFYPYHYAPWGSDLGRCSPANISFDLGQPFAPFDQLMSVFPAASASHIPPPLRSLMTDAESAVLDFYPPTFPVDPNGKRAAWQGVALLPFIDEARLLGAVRQRYPLISPDDMERNVTRTHDTLYLNTDQSLNGDAGTAPFNGTFLNDTGNDDKCKHVSYKVPFAGEHDLQFVRDLFPGTQMPAPLLTPDELESVRRGEAAKRFPNILSYRPSNHHLQNSNSNRSRPSGGGRLNPMGPVARSANPTPNYSNLSDSSSLASSSQSSYHQSASHNDALFRQGYDSRNQASYGRNGSSQLSAYDYYASQPHQPNARSDYYAYHFQQQDNPHLRQRNDYHAADSNYQQQPAQKSFQTSRPARNNGNHIHHGNSPQTNPEPAMRPLRQFTTFASSSPSPSSSTNSSDPHTTSGGQQTTSAPASYDRTTIAQAASEFLPKSNDRR